MDTNHDVTIMDVTDVTGQLPKMAKMDINSYLVGQRPKARLASMSQSTELPDDPALPGLAAIRSLGLARAMPALGLQDSPVELISCRHVPKSHITLEARTGSGRFAVKAYAKDPSKEAELYLALGENGVAGTSECRVPPLLAWDRELKMLAIGWLEGPSAEQLILAGQGARAGELAAQWLRHAASLPIKLGPPYGAAEIAARKPRKIAADLALEMSATAIARKLRRIQPETDSSRLVHGTFYSHHIIDLGNGPGVIDWEHFGQGPIELDAGIFLASAWRTRMWPERPEAEVTRAEESFLAGMDGLLDKDAVAWHRSAMLLRLACKLARRQDESDWSARAHALMREASRFDIAGESSSPV